MSLLTDCTASVVVSPKATISARQEYSVTADIYPPLMSLRVMLSVEEMMAVFISMTLSVAYGLAIATAVLYKLVTRVAIIIRNKAI